MTNAVTAHEREFRQRLERALGTGYELRRLVGHGGFAVVYAAFDRQLKRDVAVKVLRPELYDVPAVRERFRREAESAARLRHPHIIPIYAVGDEHGLAFLIMPLIAGQSLQAELERDGRLSAEEARRVLIETAEALAAAHRAGLVHRDIKPDNILLEGDERRVVVTDFGIAKAVEGEGERLTQTGAVVGTPQYMSPEQASGERAIDHRSDLYSLGVVGYRTLAGEVPFSGATVAAVLVKHLAEEPPTVSRRRPDCPADLATAVMRCLAKDPARRWQSAEELARALRKSAAEVAPGEAVPAPGDRGAAPDPLRRFRRVLVAAAAAMLALVAADVARREVLFGPLGVIVAAFFVAAQYGRLWMAGYGWRDVFTPGSLGRAATPPSLDSLELGPHLVAVQQARADRAAMLAHIQRLPKAERGVVGGLLPVVDRVLARATEDARRLAATERQIEPGPAELERRLAATRAEPPSPGREQRVAVLERRREAVLGLLERRERLASELSGVLAAVGKARFELERGSGTGQAAQVALATLRAAEGTGPD